MREVCGSAVGFVCDCEPSSRLDALFRDCDVTESLKLVPFDVPSKALNTTDILRTLGLLRGPLGSLFGALISIFP